MTTLQSTTHNNQNRWKGFLILWVCVGAVLQIPIFDTFTAKLFVLIPAVFFTILATLIKPESILPLWAIVLGFLVTQTGFQLKTGATTTSALEIIIAVVMLIILFTKKSIYQNHQSIQIPGQKFLVGFFIYSLILYGVTLFLGTDPLIAITQMKGFILYPLMLYIFVSAIRRKETLIWAIVIPLIVLVITSGQSILDYNAGITSGQEYVRIGAEYATINLYGITMASFSLFCLGLSSYYKWGLKQFLLLAISLFLFVSSLTSVSRTVWILYAVGLLILFVYKHNLRVFILLILGIMIILLINNPENISWRIPQTSDSSSIKRLFYLNSGWEAFKVYWPIGAGWGNGQWYYPGIGLIPTGFIPWYHNDYLNLAVQTGILGVILYTGFWIRVIAFSFKNINFRAGSFEMSVAVGSLAGLIGLLVAAGFEHVLWRPDIAGVVGWMVGILLSSINLEMQNKVSQLG